MVYVFETGLGVDSECEIAMDKSQEGTIYAAEGSLLK